MDHFLAAMKAILRAADGEHFRLVRLGNSKATIRLFLKPVIERIQRDQIRSETLGHAVFELHNYSYGSVIHLQN